MQFQAVNPVAVGKARGRHQTYRVGEYLPVDDEKPAKMGNEILCFQVHGDASFAAQV